MTERLFLFLVHGLAAPTSAYRPGARHAMMIYAAGRTIIDARLTAVTKAQDSFWTHVEVKREKEVDRDIRSMSDETLKAAAETALARGSSIVVYLEEVPLNS